MSSTVFRTDSRVGSTAYLTDLKAVLDSLSLADVDTFIDYIHDAYERHARIFIAGNGGSAATASHMACDLAKTTRGTGSASWVRGLRAIALTDNMPLVTAWGNDVDYSTVFAEQVSNLADSTDLLIVITASGNSPNIVEAVKAASALHMRSIGLLGFDGGVVKPLLDQSVVVHSNDFGHIEDAHMVLTHLITAHFKQVCAQQR